VQICRERFRKRFRLVDPVDRANYNANPYSRGKAESANSGKSARTKRNARSRRVTCPPRSRGIVAINRPMIHRPRRIVHPAAVAAWAAAAKKGGKKKRKGGFSLPEGGTRASVARGDRAGHRVRASSRKLTKANSAETFFSSLNKAKREARVRECLHRECNRGIRMPRDANDSRDFIDRVGDPGN
jgi:hypothetical protein